MASSMQHIWKSREKSKPRNSPILEVPPSKLEKTVEECDMKLSAAEKQRVGVIRYFVKKPVHVSLDEASSSLDLSTN